MIRLPRLLRLIGFDICDTLLLVGINVWIFIDYTHIHIFINLHMVYGMVWYLQVNLFTMKKKQLNN